MPISLGILMLTLLVAGVAFQQAQTANGGANRDRGVKRAVAAAESGVDVAIYRIKKLKLTAAQCVNGTTPLSTTGYGPTIPGTPRAWCAASAAESLGSGASFTYRVSEPTQGADGKTRRVVIGTGTANGVTRRVSTDVVVAAGGGNPLFRGYGILSLNTSIVGSNAVLNGDIASNGNVTLSSGAQVCGNAEAGGSVGGSGVVTCGGLARSGQPPFALAPVTIPSDAGADNGRICNGGDTCTGSVSVNAYTKALMLGGGATLTLRGSSYRFCSVSAGASAKLIIASPAVKIYIDSPENCGGIGGGFSLGGSGSIQNNNSDPTSLQIYVAGSPSRPTTVAIGGSGATTLPVVVYAPLSTVQVGASANYTGAIAGQTVNVGATVTFNSSSAVDTIGDGTTSAPSFTRDAGSFRECGASVTATESPDTRC